MAERKKQTTKSGNNTPSRLNRRARVPKSKVIRTGPFGGIVTRERKKARLVEGVYVRNGIGGPPVYVDASRNMERN